MLNDFDKAKAGAWEAHRQEFTCDCLFTTLRKRTIANGSIQFVRQCLTCGRSVGNPERKTPELAAVATPWDQAILDKYEARRSSSSEEIKKKYDRAAFFRSYDQYLASPEWLEKRGLVLRRANSQCEGCGVQPAEEVHHLTYEHVGNEFLFELVALCHCCHERIHGDK